MAFTSFEMIIFNRFRHVLTRHDPKTYLIWCEALSVTLGFDVPPLRRKKGQLRILIQILECIFSTDQSYLGSTPRGIIQ